MTNIYYTLIETYPNSPELGTIITPVDNEYYQYRPDEWSKYWKKSKIGDVVCKSLDGYDLKQGEQCYYIQPNGKICNRYVTSLDFQRTDLFFDVENAKRGVIENIEVHIENETIKGEDIPLYGVLASTNWQLEEQTSKDLFYRYKRSERWKYFRTVEEREDYIFKNKPRFSYLDILALRHCPDNETLIKVIKENYA